MLKHKDLVCLKADKLKTIGSVHEVNVDGSRVIVEWSNGVRSLYEAGQLVLASVAFAKAQKHE